MPSHPALPLPTTCVKYVALPLLCPPPPSFLPSSSSPPPSRPPTRQNGNQTSSTADPDAIRTSITKGHVPKTHNPRHTLPASILISLSFFTLSHKWNEYLHFRIIIIFCICVYIFHILTFAEGGGCWHEGRFLRVPRRGGGQLDGRENGSREQRFVAEYRVTFNG